MIKKHLLFVIDSLGVGGAEKSLLTFLSVLDDNRFEVDLQLFGYGGQLERYIPKTVHLLPSLPYTRYLQESLWGHILSVSPLKTCNRILFSWAIRKKGLWHIDRARLYWKYFSRFFDTTKEYDIAIAYAQNLPTLYVADKVQARKKFAWVNVDYIPEGKNHHFYKPYYNKIDNIVAVSQSAKESFIKAYPDSQPKTTVIMDMVDGRVVEQMSMAECGIKIEKDVPSLLTMARLNKPQKGYDMALEACRILTERGVTFRWYALGEGPYRSEMEQYIREHHLEDTFILLGALPNPYPVFKRFRLWAG